MSAGAPAAVAVVGLGAMGSRLAANLLADGHRVTVANRTAVAAEPLVAAGARAAGTPREAAAAAGVVLVCVSDDEASRAVWTDPASGILAAARDGLVGVEASTVSPGWAAELADRAAAAGIGFLEAPMVGSRPQVEARALHVLVGGDPDLLERVRPVLAASAAAVHRTGAPGSAATAKLLVNALFAIQVEAVAELLAYASGRGLDPETARELIGALPVASPAAMRAADAMLARRFEAAFPLRLLVKDLRYLLAGGPSPLAETVLSAADRLVAAGRGEDDAVVLARPWLDPERTTTHRP